MRLQGSRRSIAPSPFDKSRRPSVSSFVVLYKTRTSDQDRHDRQQPPQVRRNASKQKPIPLSPRRRYHRPKAYTSLSLLCLSLLALQQRKPESQDPRNLTFCNLNRYRRNLFFNEPSRPPTNSAFIAKVPTSVTHKWREQTFRYGQTKGIVGHTTRSDKTVRILLVGAKRQYSPALGKGCSDALRTRKPVKTARSIRGCQFHVFHALVIDR